MNNSDAGASQKYAILGPKFKRLTLHFNLTREVT